jgi:hypothetical protein
MKHGCLTSMSIDEQKMNLLGVDGEHLGHVNHYFHTNLDLGRKFQNQNSTSEKRFKKIGRYFRVFLG